MILLILGSSVMVDFYWDDGSAVETYDAGLLQDWGPAYNKVSISKIALIKVKNSYSDFSQYN